MSKQNRTSTSIAWTLCGVTTLLSVANLPLLFANNTQVVDFLMPAPAFLAFAVVGALIITHQPRNTIGWLYCLIGVSIALFGFAQEYAAYTLITKPHALPGGMLMAWLGRDWTGFIGWALLVMVVPLLFPNGRLPSPRWQPYAWLLGVVIAFYLAMAAFDTYPMSNVYPQIVNPLAVAWVDRLVYISRLIPANLLCPLISFASLVGRYRHAHATERQQIKWLAYTAALIPVAAMVSILSAVLRISTVWDHRLTLLFWMPAYFSFPAATGIAILRYRLYDIDRLISRTLAYGVLTTLLALIYFGSVVVLGNFFQSVLGLTSNQLVTVIATLLMAALFTPLRRRVQEVIDRRFYRRKYNAEHVLTAFGATVRDETNLEQLTPKLMGVVEETLQPAHSTLWLKPAALTPRLYGEIYKEGA